MEQPRRVSQQAVADAVDPADDAGGVHLDDAVEGVVQQGVDLGGVVLFQIDGVAHPAGEVQRVVDALAAGGNVLVGQFFLPGGLADDIAADDADTAVGLRLGHRISQLLVLAHHVQLQLDPEKLVEPGSVAEHIGNADQTDPRTGKCQLRFELEHHGGQLLQGHTDLDHRQLDALLDDPSLHTAGHDQVTALPFQLSGPALSLARLDVFQGHERDGWECPDKGLCQVAQLLAGHENGYLCHAVVLLCSGLMKKAARHTAGRREASVSQPRFYRSMIAEFERNEKSSEISGRSRCRSASRSTGQWRCGQPGPCRCCAATAALPGPRRSWEGVRPRCVRSPKRCSGP